METAFTRIRQKSLFQAKGCIIPLTQPPTAHQGRGEQCAWAEGLATLWGSALVSFVSLLWCEGIHSVKRKSLTCCVEMSPAKAARDLHHFSALPWETPANTPPSWEGADSRSVSPFSAQSTPGQTRTWASQVGVFCGHLKLKIYLRHR